MAGSEITKWMQSFIYLFIFLQEQIYQRGRRGTAELPKWTSDPGQICST